MGDRLDHALEQGGVNADEERATGKATDLDEPSGAHAERALTIAL